MAGTPEEDLLGWLEREEQILGFEGVDDALGDINKARALFYDELGYDMTDEQYRGLNNAAFLRYDELPTIGVGYEVVETKWGVQGNFRDAITGRFVSKADTFSLLSAIRTP